MVSWQFVWGPGFQKGLPYQHSRQVQPLRECLIRNTVLKGLWFAFALWHVLHLYTVSPARGTWVLCGFCLITKRHQITSINDRSKESRPTYLGPHWGWVCASLLVHWSSSEEGGCSTGGIHPFICSPSKYFLIPACTKCYVHVVMGKKVTAYKIYHNLSNYYE